KGLELYRILAEGLEEGKLSARFPHRATERLAAYIALETPLLQERSTMKPVDAFERDCRAVVRSEFTNILNQQTLLKGADKEAFTNAVATGLEAHLNKLDSQFERQLAENK